MQKDPNFYPHLISQDPRYREALLGVSLPFSTPRTRSSVFSALLPTPTSSPWCLSWGGAGPGADNRWVLGPDSGRGAFLAVSTPSTQGQAPSILLPQPWSTLT